MFGVIVLLENLQEFLKGWCHSLLQNVTVHVGIHVSLHELELPRAGSVHAVQNHDATFIILDLVRDSSLVASLQFAITQAEHHLSQRFSWSHQTPGHGPVIHVVVHGFGLLCFQQTVFGLSGASASEEVPSVMTARHKVRALTGRPHTFFSPCSNAGCTHVIYFVKPKLGHLGAVS